MLAHLLLPRCAEISPSRMLACKRLCFYCRLYAQLLLQDLAAGFILRQGGCPLPVQRQQLHELPVGFLLPGDELQPPAGEAHRLLERFVLFIALRQLPQRFEMPVQIPLPQHPRPVVKLRAVLEREPLQKAAPVELRRRFQIGDDRSLPPAARTPPRPPTGRSPG